VRRLLAQTHLTENRTYTRVSRLLQRPDQTYLLLGTSLLMLFMAQLLLELRWTWLAQLQQGEFYRQFTGYLLLAYVLLQSRLGIKRMRNRVTNLRKEFQLHKLQGLLGPIIFYIHSIEVGYAYQMLLAFAFLGNCIVGYLSPHALPWRNQIYLISWTAIHISLAMLTLILLLFHIFVVYNYS